ncbi:hypothetical protein [Sporosarcina sp. FSL K6-3457]|uniref:hypothetical protein n=1 Tax=Sporosarcina sp. FSL K6-3457 TaxID=2978204 RepID=UPI0030FB03E1
MKTKLVLIIVGLGIILLTGCNGEVEEVLGRGSKLLDEQLAETELESAVETSEEVNEKDKEVSKVINDEGDDFGVEVSEMSDGHENEADPFQTFDERLQQAGYTEIDPPNGLMIPVPQDWVLVQVMREGPWEGVFCFDTQLEETIARVEEDMRTVGFDVQSDPILGDYDTVHSTKYSYTDGYQSGKGDLIYFIDIYGTTCATLYWEIIFE